MLEILNSFRYTNTTKKNLNPLRRIQVFKLLFIYPFEVAKLPLLRNSPAKSMLGKISLFFYSPSFFGSFFTFVSSLLYCLLPSGGGVVEGVS